MQVIRAVIQAHRNDIDINAFLVCTIDLVNRHATRAQTAPVQAILLACRNRIDTDIINRVFIDACIAKSGLVLIIIRLFNHMLTDESIETGLQLCGGDYIEASMSMVTRANRLTTRSYVVSFGICTKHSKQNPYDRRLNPSSWVQGLWVRLNNRYEAEVEAEGTVLLYYSWRGIRRCTLMDCCDHGNFDMACALIEEYPEIVCEHFLIESIEKLDIEIARLILEQYGSLLRSEIIKRVFAVACSNQDSDMIDLLIDTIGADLPQRSYTLAFDQACMMDRLVTLELLLARRPELLQFENSKQSGP